MLLHPLPPPEPRDLPLVGGGVACSDDVDPHPIHLGVVALFGHVWLRTMLGGAACGVVVLGFLTVPVVWLTVPAGLILGAILGVPVGTVLAPVIHRPRTTDAINRLATSLQIVAVFVAIAPAAFFGFGFGTAVLSMFRDPSTRGVALAIVPSAITAVVGSALVGRATGRSLAKRVVLAYGYGEATRLPFRQRGTR